MSAPFQSSALPANPSPPKTSTAVRSKTSHPLRVLIVEDDPVILDLCLEVAQRMGFQTSSADSIVSARAVLPQPVDIVLLDIRLPEGEGLSLLDAIRIQHPSAI